MKREIGVALICLLVSAVILPVTKYRLFSHISQIHASLYRFEEEK